MADPQSGHSTPRHHIPNDAPHYSWSICNLRRLLFIEFLESNPHFQFTASRSQRTRIFKNIGHITGVSLGTFLLSWADRKQSLTPNRWLHIIFIDTGLQLEFGSAPMKFAFFLIATLTVARSKSTWKKTIKWALLQKSPSWYSVRSKLFPMLIPCRNLNLNAFKNRTHSGPRKDKSPLKFSIGRKHPSKTMRHTQFNFKFHRY